MAAPDFLLRSYYGVPPPPKPLPSISAAKNIRTPSTTTNALHLCPPGLVLPACAKELTTQGCRTPRRGNCQDWTVPLDPKAGRSTRLEQALISSGDSDGLVEAG